MGICYNRHYDKLFIKESLSKDYFLFPSSTPIDFNVQDAHNALDIIENTQVKYVYLAHTGLYKNVKQGLLQMHNHLNHYEKIMVTIDEKLDKEEQEIDKYVYNQLETYYLNELKKRDIDIMKFKTYLQQLLQMDLTLNTMGLIVAVKRFTTKSSLINK